MLDLLAQATTDPRSISTGVVVIVAVMYCGVFAWLTVAAWARQRRLEREAYYHHELEKRVAEGTGVTADQIRDLREDEHLRRWSSRREGLKLAGVVTVALGLGLFVGLRFITDKPVYQLGWIPILIGVAILGYVFLLCRSVPSKRS